MIALAAETAQQEPSILPTIITAAVALVVGFMAGAASVMSGLLTRNVQREQLAHHKEVFAVDLREKIKDDFHEASEAMGIIALETNLAIRQAQAGKARKAFVGIRLLMREIEDRDLKRLMEGLQKADEPALELALKHWPNVQEAILRNPPGQAQMKRFSQRC